ncbi:hypothetical protein [Maribacter sp. 4U21]|uniref:hypothetical protein n=1 Tax=Maribacter sp. 4U21 TaxID=1889779 RepID=UPI001C557D57|nr:hypothetical protein [Maribacter sp. 4U21]
MFDSGKYLDFGEGKWLLNQTKSNSKIFDAELYNTSLNEFRKILGDSLLELNDIRKNRLVESRISFDLDKDKLLELKEQTNCNYLINVKGVILHQGLGAVSVPTDQLDFYSSNESAVEIKIYELTTGVEMSSSSVFAKTVDQGEISKNNSIPRLNTSSHTAMLMAAKKLIRKYDKYRTD